MKGMKMNCTTTTTQALPLRNINSESVSATVFCGSIKCMPRQNNTKVENENNTNFKLV